MCSIREELRRTWKAIKALQFKSNPYKRFMLGISTLVGLVMFFLGFASEGSEVPVPWKNKMRDVMLALVPISWLISAFSNLFDPKDDEAPLLPIFRPPQDATDGSFEAYNQRAIYEQDQDISNAQLLESVEMANINSERRVHDLVLENRLLRSWVNC